MAEVNRSVSGGITAFIFADKTIIITITIIIISERMC
jgi:hypothetical protein